MDGIIQKSSSDIQNLIDIKSVNSADILPQNPEVIVQARCQINQVHPLITEFNNPECFHRSSIPVLIFSQLFGIFPISRVSNKNPKMLNYNFKSFKTFYSIIVLMAIFYLAFKSVIILFETLTNVDGCSFDTEGIIGAGFSTTFYGSIFLQCLFFFMTPRKWIDLQIKWDDMEKKLNKSNQDPPKLSRKFNTISLIMLIMFIIEHTWWSINTQTPKENDKFCDALWVDVNSSNKFSIGLEEYFLLISGIYPAYIWNFTDIFIILVTFNNHENYWNQLRINYSILSNLVKETDNVLSPLIFLSIGHNFFFICLQLFIGVSDSNESDIVKIYRPFSFVFIVMRTIGVLFSAAKINDHSKNILPIIYQCPRSKYNNETKRLLEQLTCDEVALTGMNFFSITRQFMLTSLIDMMRETSSSQREKNIFNNVKVFSTNQEIFVKPKPFIEISSTDEMVNRLFKFSEVENSESFHQAIQPIIKMSQLFGFFPMSGNDSIYPETLYFNFKSFRVLYSAVILILLAGTFLRSFLYLISTWLQLNSCNSHTIGIVGAILGCVFYGSIFTEYLIFFYLPTKWIKLQQEWQLMEIQLNKFNNNCPKLRWKFNTITIVMILLSTIEHIRRIVEIMAMKEDPKFCDALWADRSPNNSTNKFVNLISNDKFVNMAEEIFLFVINIYTSYIWNFTDLFIMLVSTGLAERYKFLNNIVINTTIWNNHENYWDQLRICYGKLSKLVKNTDQVISPLIFISCTHYFFLICLQLLLWISRDDTVTFAAVFPFFSFGFMVFSTNAVMFSASRINDHSKKILPTVYECPSVEYTNEAKRLQDQMTSDDITLTGLNFFSITRNFMLAVAGTMVTYEIVLLQFSDPKKGVY
ncbi:hypothetical protein HCN44_002577 [Aphidius gifuensis]|uniref:Gustatory receptor n=1 Tax=Aphidius gifuensis TaxID=684658 RepID=A0A834Y5M1_APHGI|nr:hypothetical protein HCN44_002577 [Aphidius gifuensis]